MPSGAIAIRQLMGALVCSPQEVWAQAMRKMSRGDTALLFPEAEMWQHQGSQSLGQDPGADFWGAGLMEPGGRSHALFPVGTGLERRTHAHEEAPPTPVSTGGPEYRKRQGKSSALQGDDAGMWEM